MLRQASSHEDDNTAPISGKTKIFAVVGDPVAQVRAPELMNNLFAAGSFDAVMIPVHVAARDLGQTMNALKSWKNLHGILVTIPHKFAACEQADTLSEMAMLAGCANAFRREPDGTWFAENFDGQGFVEGLAANGFDVTNRRVMIVGAGGAGASIAAALSRAPVKSIVISDIDPDRSAGLARRLKISGCDVTSEALETIQDNVELAINATPLGLSPTDPLPFDPKNLGPECLVADVIMKPAETKLLMAASALGLAIHGGAPMLDAQIELYRKFFGVPVSAAGDPEGAVLP
ncbi:shikimate dehydrogenase [Mesorhizobium sp. DCY119]|uniref:shikimate dehydrogenase family protein n=1 Tax=Mesorhizobium sp. DCY119 TaxID=2108445 RepID=UPI000E729E44|nr:shikimate dehydrogenase [Mesorhizobium sp. DCY119]RJG41813.1 shikimate dehydrogenase [Mesorhizobium sp. DCY119]